MSVATHPFVEAATGCLQDEAEVAVAEVAVEFLKGAADLNPGMSPGVGTIDALLVGHILNDIFRVAQGEVEVEALHGEHAAQAAGNGI